jgi:signal transduction histidine kinase
MKKSEIQDGYIIIFRDITKLKSLEEERDEFISVISHELRTPLNSVLGMTEMLAETNPTEDQQEYIKLLQSSGVFLESIINDILDFSKIEAGKMRLEYEKVSYKNILFEVQNIFSLKVAEKNIEYLNIHIW